MLSTNIGTTDRMLRIVGGILLLIFAIIGVPATSFNWIGWIGIVPLVTAAIGWCPAYTLLGLSTCPAEKRES